MQRRQGGFSEIAPPAVAVKPRAGGSISAVTICRFQEDARPMSATTLPAAPLPSRRGGTVNAPAALGGGALLLVGAAAIGQAVSPRQAALYLLGAALGLVLYHAAFGFTSAWRVFIADRRGEGLRAQMVMLAVAAALFFPTLAAGTLFGQPVQGLVAPVGVSVLFGAFLFGIGMQLGGGCA